MMLKNAIAFTIISQFFSIPVFAQSTAEIFDPPTNIRNAPNGEIICTISKRVPINVFQKEGQWYYTNACDGGYIHQSQIRFRPSNSHGDRYTDRARVVGIKQGQLALRDSPNGRSLAGLNNGNVVQIIQQQDNWAYVKVISGPNTRINGMEGWVNSHYLALF